MDFFLKIDGIEGESIDADHPNQIEVLSWSWGENNSSAADRSPGTGERVAMQDFSFTMHSNKASPKLFLACADGMYLKSAVLVCRRSGSAKSDFMKLKFSDVLISSFQVGGSAGSPPTEQVSLRFARIEYEYTPMKPDGTMSGRIVTAWDVMKNTKV